MLVVHIWECPFDEMRSYFGMAFECKWFCFGNGLLMLEVHIWEWPFNVSGSYLGMAF